MFGHLFQEGTFQQRKRKRALFLFILVGGLVLLVGALVLYQTKRQEIRDLSSVSLPEEKKSTEYIKAIFKDPAPTVQIGKDTYTKVDFDYLARVYTGGDTVDTVSEDEQEQIFEVALENALVLKEASNKKLTKVDTALFQPNKDWTSYNKAVEEAKAAIIAQEEQISVAAVFIYFMNQSPPEMGVEKSKPLTKTKMEALRGEMVEGRMTIQQAAEAIKADSSLAEIDPIYKQNSYAEFYNRNKSRQVVGGISSDDNALVWTLPVGSYSPIIIGYEAGNSSTPNEAYWVVVQIVEKKGTKPPYLEWLKGEKEAFYEVHQ